MVELSSVLAFTAVATSRLEEVFSSTSQLRLDRWCQSKMWVVGWSSLLVFKRD